MGLPLALALVLIASGCARRPAPATAPSSTESAEATAAPSPAGVEAALRPGDAVRVQIWREPDLSGEFTVNQDGLVVFPLLGEEAVTGVSATDLEKRLQADYREYLENPSVDVIALRRISILGEVRQPGLYPVDPTMSLSEALAVAGGVAPSGDKDNVRLVRDGQLIRQSVGTSALVSSTPLRSGDQIVVGERSWLSRNIWLVTSGLGAVTSILVAAVVR